MQYSSCPNLAIVSNCHRHYVLLHQTGIIKALVTLQGSFHWFSSGPLTISENLCQTRPLNKVDSYWVLLSSKRTRSSETKRVQFTCYEHAKSLGSICFLTNYFRSRTNSKWRTYLSPAQIRKQSMRTLAAFSAISPGLLCPFFSSCMSACNIDKRE